MFYTRGLLLKGILGFGAASAAAFGGLTQKERIAGWFSSGEKSSKPAEAITEDTSKLLDEVGLSCDLANATADNGVVCSKKTGDGAKNIKVKKETSTTFDVSTLPSDSGGGKIKLYKLGEDKGENGYASGLKLVIEEGNINGGEGNNKLEEFETYEIKEGTNSSKPETKTYYLNRKTKTSDKIKVLLGLDTCAFPGEANVTQPCSLTTEQIKKIKFEGKDGEVTGTGTLQISIASASETQNFPYGFKFTLTPSSGGNINIPRGTGKEALTLNASAGTVFKIKKKEDKTLTLEEALTQDALTKKVGLSCTGEGLSTTNGIQCSIATGENVKVKVKQESNTFELSSLGSGGSIKLYKAQDTEGYNKNLKVVIEGGDISGTGNSNKLEEFETYEIKEDNGDWKLTRKKKSSEEKRRILGLPSGCNLPEGAGQSQTTCSVDSTNINDIKFDGKGSETVSGSGSLQIDVVTSNDADFPHGFKFTLTPSSSDITINRGSNESWTLKNGKATEFKIKKSGTSLTLEKAWTLTTLPDKVNLSCTASSGAPTETNGVECTKKTGSSDNIKVKKNGTDFNVSNITNGKIKVYKTSSGEDHNEGFKFAIEEGDISSTNSQKLEQFETYEIKKEGSEWKLVKKTDAKDGIKKALGIDSGCDFPTDEAEKECALDDAKFKKINFENKGSVSDTVTGNPKLKISKVSGTENGDFGPFGYKFKLESSEDAKISDSVTIKKNTNTEFKIKRATGSNNISLEKAWTAKSLGEKVGLTCQENGTKECTIGDKISVKEGENAKKDAAIQNGNAGGKKLTYDDTADGHNQGIKFTTETEICLQNGEQSSGAPNSIANGGATYEILKSSDGNWYLTKKNGSGA